MSPWLIGLIVLVGFMLARGLAMAYLAIRASRAHQSMVRYWDNEIDYMEIAHRKSGIVRLLSGAHIESARVPRAQPIGLGQMVTGHFMIFDNLFRKDATSPFLSTMR